MNKKHIIALAVSTAILGGCAIGSEPQQAGARGATLATLDLSPSLQVKPLMPKLQLGELSSTYQSILDGIDDPELALKIKQRIINVDVMQLDQEQIDIPEKANAHYQRAVVSINQFLAEFPDSQHADKLMYQLAKAYDLQGKQEESLIVIQSIIKDYPNTPYLVELYFRQAEILYSQGNYNLALNSYQQVVDKPENNPYYSIALYMQGWSNFKLERHSEALTNFTDILDRLISAEHASRIYSVDAIANQLTKKEQLLLRDSFAVMTLIFNQADGAKSIQRHYSAVGPRQYEQLNYELLADDLLKKQRYTEAADVLEAFIKRYPSSETSVLFALNKLEILTQGRFPGLVLEQQQTFIADYQLTNDYWLGKSSNTREQAAQTLKQLLKVKAQNQHAAAQALELKWPQANKALAAKIAEYYQAASEGYQQYLANFPDDQAQASIRYYYAETLLKSGNIDAAIEQYQQVVNSDINHAPVSKNGALIEPFKANDHRADAAYAVILAYQTLLTHPAATEQAGKYKAAQLTAINFFLDTFNSDPRSMLLQVSLFQQRFKEKHYEQALLLAQQALLDRGRLSDAQVHSAQLVIAHSQFELAKFADAESSYTAILNVLATNNKSYEGLSDQLGLSIYRQAEAAIASEPAHMDAGIKHLKRIIKLVPNSEVRVNAQYDLAAHLLNQQQYKEAIEQLLDFNERFNGHSLSADIPTKLAFAYQETEQWSQSAKYLKQGWAKNPAGEGARELLWLAAQSYQKGGDAEQAMRAYRTYAHTYPKPLVNLLEAQFILSEYYLETKQPLKRNFWLTKLIESDANAGDTRNARSRYLAAMAANELSKIPVANFKRSKLQLPLAKSLTKKQALLNESIVALNRVLDYKVAEFSTAASYELAQLYLQLANDLMASERPTGLDELALEQYDILLEEYAYPFEEQAIAVHVNNSKSAHSGIYDEWIKRSFNELSKLQPGRYYKPEIIVEDVNDIY
ncbi:tol-pal system YbgF family protein [Psychromonas sp.]|uniref:tol-pal system YbgF family protein n=1 Tax=Psychromonas sp. TaxID=1884585 RepID=UPI003561EC8C